MRMTEMSEVRNGKQVVECLRCGHTETRIVRDK
jgi:Zn ribbon nucleic-acid-binding protein